MKIERWDDDTKIIYFVVDQKRYKAKIISLDKKTGICQLYLFNTNQTISINLFEQKKIKQEMPDEKQFNLTAIYSPISGRVTKIHVKKETLCKENQPLITIESMKMENEIQAPFDLFIKSVSIAQGDLVQQNQLLLKIERKQVTIE